MSRPPWARWLDGIALPSARVLGALTRRPTEAELHTLSGRRSNLKPAQWTPTRVASDHIGQGRQALESGFLGEALYHFGAAVQLQPDARWAWHGRGDALQLSGEYPASQDAYERAVALAPDCGIHHAGRANALQARGESSEAAQAWATALRLDPSLTWMQQG